MSPDPNCKHCDGYGGHWAESLDDCNNFCVGWATSPDDLPDDGWDDPGDKMGYTYCPCWVKRPEH